MFESLKRKLSGTIGKITDKISKEEEEEKRIICQNDSGKWMKKNSEIKKRMLKNL